MGVSKNYKILIAIVLLIAAGNADCFAQQETADTNIATRYRVRPYETVTSTVWKDSVYRFNNFEEGRVRFINGFSKTYKLNYSLASGEMEFIDANGDSLQLHGTPDLRLVNVGGRIFFHYPTAGYIEVLLQMPIALGVKRILSVERREVVGDNGYGQTSFVTTSVSSFYRASPSGLSNYDVLYEKANVYFFIDRRNVPVLATRNSLFRLFPEHRTALRMYLRQNRVNFRKEPDMMALTTFIARFY
jgi:hypothetical protein